MSSPVFQVADGAGADVIEFVHDANLDANTTENVRTGLFDLVENDQRPGFVIDLTNVAFMSSQALGMLVTLRLKAARTGKQLVLCGVHEPLTEIITLTQLDKLYEIWATRADALQRLN